MRTSATTATTKRTHTTHAEHGEHADDDRQLVAELDPRPARPRVADEHDEDERRADHDAEQRDRQRRAPRATRADHGAAPVVTPSSGADVDVDADGP